MTAQNEVNMQGELANCIPHISIVKKEYEYKLNNEGCNKPQPSTIHGQFFLIMSTTSRSSHRRCSMKKSVLRNFAKFTGKHLCQSLFLNKVAGLKETVAHVLSCEFCKISKNTFFEEYVWSTASKRGKF